MQRWIIALAALALALATVRLGLWQLDRAQQKQAIQRDIDARARLPPLTDADLARDERNAAAQHHRRVEVSGTWRREFTVFIDNRQLRGASGFIVVTPLQLDDGTAVLVQRGWLARDPADRTRVTDPPTPAAAVRLRGLAAPPPTRLYEFDGAASGPIRQNLDLGVAARESGLALRPLTILQLEAAAPGDDALVREWPAPAAGATKNLGYAFQWFALCALTVGLYVWFQLIGPRRRKA